MIPSHSSKHILQYNGLIVDNIHIKTPGSVKKIKITDTTTKLVLFDENVFIHSTMEWSLDGYREDDIRIVYHTVSPIDGECELVLVINKDHKIQVGSLNFFYKNRSQSTVEYKFQCDMHANQNGSYEIVID
jgi:hypothetical protein